VPSTLSSAALSPVAVTLRTSAKVLLFALLTVAGFIALSGGTTDGATKAHAATVSFRAKAVQIAAYQKGDPYRYGAAGPNAFDCSGLTMFAYRQVGRSLVHNAAGQYRQTVHYIRSQKRPGDLLFYTSNGRGSGIYHVAIYAGNGYQWAAPHSGTRVQRQRIYSSHYLVGRVRS
jgi:cell wall-associated NlpC family hydrolase